LIFFDLDEEIKNSISDNGDFLWNLVYDLGISLRVGLSIISFLFLKKENKRMPFPSLMREAVSGDDLG